MLGETVIRSTVVVIAVLPTVALGAADAAPDGRATSFGTDKLAVPAGVVQRCQDLAFRLEPRPGTVVLEAENGASRDQIENKRLRTRSAASGTGGGKRIPPKATIHLYAGEEVNLRFSLDVRGTYALRTRYSNDSVTARGPGRPERVTAYVDGARVGEFFVRNTRRPNPKCMFGSGWNVFRWSGVIARNKLSAARHELRLAVTAGDDYGVEIDVVTLTRI